MEPRQTKYNLHREGKKNDFPPRSPPRSSTARRVVPRLLLALGVSLLLIIISPHRRALLLRSARRRILHGRRGLFPVLGTLRRPGECVSL